METRGLLRMIQEGIPGWRSGLAPAFGPGCDLGEPGSSPTSGSRCMEPASPSACVSASLSLSVTIIKKINAGYGDSLQRKMTQKAEHLGSLKTKQNQDASPEFFPPDAPSNPR